MVLGTKPQAYGSLDRGSCPVGATWRPCAVAGARGTIPGACTGRGVGEGKDGARAGGFAAPGARCTELGASGLAEEGELDVAGDKVVFSSPVWQNFTLHSGGTPTPGLPAFKPRQGGTLASAAHKALPISIAAGE